METEVFTISTLLLESSVWEAMALFIISFVVIHFVKAIANNIFQYLVIKTELFGIGTEVVYSGKNAIICEIKFRWIVLRDSKSGDTIYVKSDDWHKMTLIVSNNTKNDGS